MRLGKQQWLTIALLNLSIVALLGFTLRSKILFPLESINFQYVLHAHSHFAFGGWVTLAILTLMTFEILPPEAANKPVYNWLLAGILFSAMGMLIAFLYQGYAFYSIFFSTLFIFVTYGYSYVFIIDLYKAKPSNSIFILGIASFICLVLSSAGPFTLAYLMASHSGNALLFRDAIYTYLHFQYNGFFTLAVFSLLINILQNRFSKQDHYVAKKFALILSLSALPSLFISYLWHFPGIIIQSIALIGCVFIIAMLFYLAQFIKVMLVSAKGVNKFAKNVATLAVIAFIIKSILQMGTVIPWLGKLVFGDRAVIIGYIHLVLLGFVTLYLLSNLLYNRTLEPSHSLTRIAVIVFITGVIANEVILMVQGFGNMLMIAYNLYSWLLWGASIWLFTGAFLMITSRIIYSARTGNAVYRHRIATK
jgi:hypothetical protein